MARALAIISSISKELIYMIKTLASLFLPPTPKAVLGVVGGILSFVSSLQCLTLLPIKTMPHTRWELPFGPRMGRCLIRELLNKAN